MTSGTHEPEVRSAGRNDGDQSPSEDDERPDGGRGDPWPDEIAFSREYQRPGGITPRTRARSPIGVGAEGDGQIDVEILTTRPSP